MYGTGNVMPKNARPTSYSKGGKYGNMVASSCPCVDKRADNGRSNKKTSVIKIKRV